MPRFEEFSALRYAPGLVPADVLAPPYDVLSPADIAALQRRDPHNIAWIDDPGDDYAGAARRLADWVSAGVLVRDRVPSFTIDRTTFTDAAGARRTTAAVLGALEVVDPGGTGVLPHEQTTPHAKSDRLDLTRATAANLSPVWGLSLASGLTAELAAPGEPLGTVTVAGVTHAVERVTDPARVARIRAIVASDDVLIADGHHRYAVAQTYRDEARAATGSRTTAAELTLAYVGELIEDQLSIEAIHRLVTGIGRDELRAALGRCFTLSPADQPAMTTLATMSATGRLCLLWPDGTAQWLTPRPDAVSTLRHLDGLYLEAALSGTSAAVTYQHGLPEMLAAVATGDYTAGILIRPTSLDEIRVTARTGALMPPKSTYFTPKPLTGWVLRELERIH